MKMIDLDKLLYDNNPPSWEEVVEFFRDGEFHEEQYRVAAIEQYLQTEEQRLEMFNRHISIEKIMNGRVAGEDNHRFIDKLFSEWNAKLGFRCFGF